MRIYLDDGSNGLATTTHYTGTECYLSYELIVAEEEASPTIASDIHALGCIGLEFIFLKLPYSHRRNNFRGIIYTDIKAGIPPSYGLSPPEGSNVDEWWDVLAQCWDIDPTKRPTSDYLLERLSAWCTGLLSNKITSVAGSNPGSVHSRNSGISSRGFPRSRVAAIVQLDPSPKMVYSHLKAGSNSHNAPGLPPRFLKPLIGDQVSRRMTPEISRSPSIIRPFTSSVANSPSPVPSRTEGSPRLELRPTSIERRSPESSFSQSRSVNRQSRTSHQLVPLTHQQVVVITPQQVPLGHETEHQVRYPAGSPKKKKRFSVLGGLLSRVFRGRKRATTHSEDYPNPNLQASPYHPQIPPLHTQAPRLHIGAPWSALVRIQGPSTQPYSIAPASGMLSPPTFPPAYASAYIPSREERRSRSRSPGWIPVRRNPSRSRHAVIGGRSYSTLSLQRSAAPALPPLPRSSSPDYPSWLPRRSLIPSNTQAGDARLARIPIRRPDLFSYSPPRRGRQSGSRSSSRRENSQSPWLIPTSGPGRSSPVSLSSRASFLSASTPSLHDAFDRRIEASSLTGTRLPSALRSVHSLGDHIDYGRHIESWQLDRDSVSSGRRRVGRGRRWASTSISPASQPPFNPEQGTSYPWDQPYAESAVEYDSSRRQWTKGQLIRRTTYAKVFLGFDIQTSEAYPVKCMEMPGMDDILEWQRVLDLFTAEVGMLRQLEHPNIISFLGDEESSESPLIFMEHMPGGSIMDYFHNLGSGFEQNHARKCTKQILDALIYIHYRCIIHRGLTSDKILVDQNGVCKISDFETAIYAEDTIYAPHQYETPAALLGFSAAPELTTHSPEYGGKVDIWSLGCVVLEMHTGEQPWALKPLEDVLELLSSNETVRPPQIPSDTGISLDGINFLQECFHVEPSGRPTAEELLSHSFVN